MLKKALVFVSLIVIFGGCAKKQVLKPTDLSGKNAGQSEPDIRQTDWHNAPEVKTINFEYDRADLDGAARAILKKNAEYLKANPDINILAEGHCDERGTIEYNLGLGQRRAASVRDYYGKLGVSIGRVGTISYGEEKPLDMGHTQEAWAKNRRVETKIRKNKTQEDKMGAESMKNKPQTGKDMKKEKKYENVNETDMKKEINMDSKSKEDAK